MGKINILKNKSNGKRAGEFSMLDCHSINLNVGFQSKPEFKKELLELLEKYFDIIILSQNSNKKGRGSITKAFSRLKRLEKIKSGN